jgi:hypothetical protein
MHMVTCFTTLTTAVCPAGSAMQLILLTCDAGNVGQILEYNPADRTLKWRGNVASRPSPAH